VPTFEEAVFALQQQLWTEADEGVRDHGLDAYVAAAREQWSALSAEEKVAARRAAEELGQLVRRRPEARAAAGAEFDTYDGPADPDRLLAHLGLSGFRPGQREAIEAALSGRDSLVVMPTGGGKSLCYQLPGLATAALTVVVSPLVALMADQLARLTKDGHPAVMIASGMQEDEYRSSYDALRSGAARIVFCSPERFASPGFLELLERRGVDLFVIDEAHCLAEWGHDFRPDYLRLPAAIERLGRPTVMAATATATEAVAEEIIGRLGLRDPVLIRSGFDRPNLSFDVIGFEGRGTMDAKRATLLGALSDPGLLPAIVYCGTRKDCESVAEALSAAGHRASHYHAGLPSETRSRTQRAFMAGELDVIACTNAFGMGVDKADVRMVCHWAMPTSVEAYYQEAGRGGRDGELSRALLLASRADLSRLIHFNQQRAIEPEAVGAYRQRLLRRSDGGVIEIPAPENDDDRMSLAIVERAGGAKLEPVGGGGLRVTIAPQLDERAVRQICAQAVDRGWKAYRAIEAYAFGETCRRRTLLDHFGDATPGAPLGRCCDICDPELGLNPPVKRPAKQRGSGGSGRGPAEPSPFTPDPKIYEALVAWRKETADDKPAYTVANNRTLEAIADLKPSSGRELEAIKGVGPSFMERYADEVLAIVAGD